MRKLVAVTALAVLAIYGPTLFWQLRTMIDAERTAQETAVQARTAIAVRCGDTPADAAAEDDCERSLRRQFAAGVREPDEILRLHCTRVRSPWAADVEPPDDVCRELYGGWIEG